MKRILYILLTLSIVILSLTACLLVPPSGGGGDPVDVKIYDAGSEIELVRGESATDECKQALQIISEAMTPLVALLESKTDIYPKYGVEIVFGNTTREVSAKAIEYLNANSTVTSGGDRMAFAIYCHGDSVGIVATDDKALIAAADYFVKNYLTSDALTLKVGHAYIGYITYTEYMQQREDEAWAARFDKAYEVMGKEAGDALVRLYDYYGSETCEWLAELYDADIGAFYYAISARDNYPFLPDVESTAQALGMLRFSGILGSGTSVELFKQFPEEIRRGFYNFAMSLKADDGYFYHPQWGSDIGSSRRGRDYDQANSLLTWFADVSTTSAVSRVVSSQVVATASVNLPDWMTAYKNGDEGPVLEYLDKLKVHQDSHSAGHTLSSQTSQIKMVDGLHDFICDYLDEKQEEIQAQLRAEGKPENGLWELEANYRSLSGLIKVGSFYGSRQVNYSDKMLEGAISVILSDKLSEAELYQIVYIFNPWGGLSVCVSNQLSANAAAREAGLPEPNDMSKTYQTIYDAFPEMVDMTIKKLALFRQEKGSYSYYQGRSAPTTQGVTVSLGLPEGDVNGTICAIQYTLDAIFGSLGITKVPLNKPSELADIIEIMQSGHIIKNPPAEKTEHNFDSEDISYLVDVSGVVGEIKNDPTNAENGVLSVYTEDGTYGSMKIGSDYAMGTESCYKFIADMYFTKDSFSSSKGQVRSHQIYLANGNKYAYMLYIETKGNRIYIRDNSNASTMGSATDTDLTFVADMGEWFNLRVEYYPMDDGTMKAKIFKNDVLLAVSENHYEKDKGSAAPQKVDGVYINCMTWTTSELLLDNVMCYCDETAFEGGSPTEAETVFTFDDGKQPTFIDATAGTTTVENGELVFTSEAGVLGNALYLYPTNYLSSVSCFSFSATMRIEQGTDNGITHQFFFKKGNSAWATSYLMVIRVQDGQVFIQDMSTDGNDPVIGINALAANVGEDFDLRVEYYPIYEVDDDTGETVLSTLKFRIYVDEELVGESENNYIKSDGTPIRNNIVDNIVILSLRAPKSILVFDEISMLYSQDIEYED